MLPTRPRSRVRSTCNSCTAPLSMMATRVSWGVQLMRMSCEWGMGGNLPHATQMDVAQHMPSGLLVACHRQQTCSHLCSLHGFVAIGHQPTQDEAQTLGQ